MVNIWATIPLYGNLSLHLGEVFVLGCLRLRGLLPALIASLLATAALVFETGNWVFFFSATLEVLVLHYLLSIGVLLLIADIIFWVLVGVPITFVVVTLFYNIGSSDFVQVILLKQALNGLLVVSIVALLLPFAPSHWSRKLVTKEVPSLSSRVFELSLISIALPALVVSLVLSDNSANNAERQMDKLLQLRTQHYVNAIESHIDTHRTAIQGVAWLLSSNNVQVAEVEQMLDRLSLLYPGFLTLMVTDAQGLVIHGAPQDYFERIKALPVESRLVTDREYFRVPRDSGQGFVSEVFQGRGFGNDPIIAISQPLTDDQQGFNGIVEGSLYLPRFDDIEGSMPVPEGYMIVLDQKGNIVYASPELQLKVLASFEPQAVSQRFTNSLDMLQSEGRQYLYHSATTQSGWRVFSLAEPSILIGAYSKDFVRLTLALLIVSFLALVVTRRFSRQITQPLESLVHNFSAHQPIPEAQEGTQTSREVESVREQLQEAQHLTLEYQENLKAEVSKKTAELMAMNERLEVMSVQDELTKIYNRRGFERAVSKVYKLACRNKTPITFAIIDIDFFKRVNDTWGHAVGDECLVMVADELRQAFQRETDFYARYGGEEFVVFLSGGNTDKHCRMLEALRKSIANRKVPVNGDSVSLTISIGVYSLQQDFDLDYHQLVSKADNLLYQSKRDGRNRITCGSQ